jgi:GNAT superfamily N-acetyltransferase
VEESDVNVAIVRVEGRERRVVAYVRALTDGVFRAVGYDFVVAKDERGGGVGRLLVSRLLADPRLRGLPAIELHCTADRIDFFRQIGFTKHVDGSVYLRHVGRKD